MHACSTRSPFLTRLAAAALLAPAALALGQEPASRPATARGPAGPLPKAEEILDKAIEATGGRAAYEKVRNRVTTASVSFASAGVKGSMKLYAAAPDKSCAVSDLGALGKAQEGSNGKLAWEVTTMTGPRLKEGAEKAQVLRAATFNAELRWRDIFKKAECTGIEAVDGRDCYVVVLTPEDGAPFTNYIDKSSYLTLKVTTTLTMPMGSLPIEVLFSDYRKVDGILLPHTIRNRVAMQEMVISVEKIEHNVEIPQDVFDPPPEIVELLEASKAPSSAPAATRPAKP